MMPNDSVYGGWPRSGEIDIVESRGNFQDGCGGGLEEFGSTLHWGPNPGTDGWEQGHAAYDMPSGSLNDDFHTYELEWSEYNIVTKIDD